VYKAKDVSDLADDRCEYAADRDTKAKRYA
jgi:hypothetical protein